MTNAEENITTPMNERKNKREWTRIQKELKVDVVSVVPRGGRASLKLDPILTKDVSGNGLGFVVSTDCAVGSILNLCFELPDRKETIQASAKVIWSKPKEETGRAHQIGVAFQEIEDLDRLAIIRYVEIEAKREAQGKI